MANQTRISVVVQYYPVTQGHAHKKALIWNTGEMCHNVKKDAKQVLSGVHAVALKMHLLATTSENPKSLMRQEFVLLIY